MRIARIPTPCFLLLAFLLYLVPAPALCADSAPAPAPEQMALSAPAAFALMAGNAEKGDPAAMLSLGRLYEYGHGTTRNYTKALEWYGKAAQTGLPEGYYNVGVCYEVGIGTASDLKKAAENYTKAADLKLPLAMHKMAAYYFNGTGVAKDEVKALQYLIKAGEAGLPQAANDLGLIYMQGLYGQPKDTGVALDWFIFGADEGSLDAMANIAAYFDENTPVKVNLVKSLKWYLILQKLGVENESVDARITELRKKLQAPQAKTAESEADAWVGDFRARHKQ